MGKSLGSAPRTLLSSLGWIGGMVLILTHMAWAEPQVLGIRHWSAPSSTRVVIDLSDKVNFRTFSLSNPPRVVVDLKGTRASGDAKVLSIGDSLVKRVRLAPHTREILRLVLDLRSAGVRHWSFLLPPVDDRPFRLVIDVESPQLGQRIQEKRRRVGKERLGRARVVVIDPGHGGEDPGALGPKGTKEKDVVLSIAKALQRRLDQRPGIRAFLTRTGDYFLGLKKRVEVAQDYGANLFVSIHADASSNRRTSGASVYCLSLRGATDEAARILAEKENASDLIGGVRLDGDPNLNTILLDLVQTQTINDSLKFGGMVLEEIEGIQRIRFSMPRQAGFRVLKAPDIPSILVEVGFVTHAEEERLLRSSSFQKKMARALEASTCRFLCEQGPAAPGHLPLAFCQEPNPRAHVVQPGQNLSQIAVLYRTSVQEIKRFNGLKDISHIYPGQRIMIP